MPDSQEEKNGMPESQEEQNGMPDSQEEQNTTPESKEDDVVMTETSKAEKNKKADESQDDGKVQALIAELEEVKQQLKLKNVRCWHCKDLGHKVKDCK